jgi:hypothetical protein
MYVLPVFKELFEPNSCFTFTFDSEVRDSDVRDFDVRGFDVRDSYTQLRTCDIALPASHALVTGW